METHLPGGQSHPFFSVALKSSLMALRGEVVKIEKTTVLCVWTLDYVNSQIQF